LPTQGILSIASDCAARTDDRIWIAHHKIQSEREEVLSSSYVEDIDQIPKVVWDPLNLNSINRTVEIALINKEIKYLKDINGFAFSSHFLTCFFKTRINNNNNHGIICHKKI